MLSTSGERPASLVASRKTKGYPTSDCASVIFDKNIPVINTRKKKQKCFIRCVGNSSFFIFLFFIFNCFIIYKLVPIHISKGESLKTLTFLNFVKSQ